MGLCHRGDHRGNVATSLFPGPTSVTRGSVDGPGVLCRPVSESLMILDTTPVTVFDICTKCWFSLETFLYRPHTCLFPLVVPSLPPVSTLGTVYIHVLLCCDDAIPEPSGSSVPPQHPPKL